jgi:hypothetical protein
MNTVQEPLSAAFPAPCSDPPASKVNNSPNVNTAALDPFRCQFSFSDGRQCRMQSSQLCAHHAAKQERDPGAGGAPDAALPGLEALCGDLTTATNINRALAQVFLLMAQGRIAQKQAVAFGYLSQLLLQTVPGIRSEFVSAFGYHPWEAKLKTSLTPNIDEDPEPPSGESDDATSIVIPSEQRESRDLSVPTPSNKAELSPVNKVSVGEGTLPDPVPFPDYSSLVSRSRDLLDGKYATTPEGRREANSLLTELELMEPPASKPPKGARASVIEHMKRWIASRRESPSTAPEIKLREDHSVAPPASRHAEPEFPITGVSQQTQLEQQTSPARPLRDKAAPPRSHPERLPKPRAEAPFETKASLWDGRYRPPTFIDPLQRPTAFERKLRRMSSYQFRRFLELQHAKSFFD